MFVLLYEWVYGDSHFTRIWHEPF